MDFPVTEDQHALQEGVRSFCGGGAVGIGTSGPAARAEKTQGFDCELWSKLAAGVFAGAAEGTAVVGGLDRSG